MSLYSKHLCLKLILKENFFFFANWHLLAVRKDVFVLLAALILCDYKIARAGSNVKVFQKNRLPAKRFFVSKVF